MNMNIIIDEEFKSLIPPLTQDEYAGLEESILMDGCRDALILWGNILVDGHNRFEICKKHNVHFNTVQRDFADRNEVKLWMMRNQLSRRNLNDFQRIEIVHRCEDAVKAKAEERRTSTLKQNANTDKEKFPERSQSRDELGAMAGVSGKTYEHAVKVMESAPEEKLQQLRDGDISINKAYQEITRPHVTNNSGNNEWYTPEKYINLAREVLGTIDTDPASCEYANRTVKAKIFYSIDNSGLDKSWNGKVWMNPPYAADLVQKFADKFIAEYVVGHVTEGIVLVNNATETAWFCSLANVASAVAFPKGRIRYQSPTKESNAPLQGQAFIYFGDNTEKFCQVFSDIGWCACLWGDDE